MTRKPQIIKYDPRQAEGTKFHIINKLNKLTPGLGCFFSCGCGARTYMKLELDVMSSSVLTVSDQQLSAFGPERSDLSV